MYKHILFFLFFLTTLCANAADRPQTLAGLRAALEANSTKAVQEKVYIHTDNNCYFIGDTLWYKAYVVRADDLRFTDMSRLLYVELLTPDGLLVERQTLVVSDKGLGDGAFILHDSLYSGYYELRAYTRWMLNFNEEPVRTIRYDRESFYNYQMARDFFRKWEGLYSRVLPIYSKPDEAGDYTYKRMASRPKQRIAKQAKEKLQAAFYPEGGHLVRGVPCRVAFELTSQEGEAVNLKGRITDGEQTVAETATRHMGRGSFTVTPGDKRLKASFTWHGKDYTFDLPKAEDTGATLRLEGGKATFQVKGLADGTPLGVSILCRGTLQAFEELTPTGGKFTMALPETLPTGVNDITLFTADGRILADRLFFVNHHDRDALDISSTASDRTTYEPYQPVSLDVQCEGAVSPTLLSVAVRDTRTDEPTYDDGDIMTDLLLGSELRGFVAKPAYYFEADDEQHRAALDLLMMVQGWRKYKWEELTDESELRYKPETTLTVEGTIYKVPNIQPVEPDEIAGWAKNSGYTTDDEDDKEQQGGETTDPFGDSEENPGNSISTTVDPLATDATGESSEGNGGIRSTYVLGGDRARGVNLRGLNHEVMVEAEIIINNKVYGTAQRTHDGGQYVFQIPPFYGVGTLNMKAYNENDSVKKNMLSRNDKGFTNEDALPDYYVKRNLFHPRFTLPYNYYQDHAPDFVAAPDTVSELSMENDEHQLANVNVKGKRRGKRAIDYKKPAYVCDAYEMYNELTDYGLSYGIYDMRLFPIRVSQYLFGNMNRHRRFNVAARLNRFTYYRNFQPEPGIRLLDNRNVRAYYGKLKLKRLADIRVYTDYEPRNSDLPMEQSVYLPDVTLDFQNIANDGVQHTFRDRHIILPGLDAPTQFYQPDYSKQKPAEPTDYRRTLYWNPNLQTDGEGHATVNFYTGSKPVRVKVSACGITPDGRFARSK